MATFERQIDALGGSANSGSNYDQAYHDGYSAALDLAIPIGADADQVIAELVEALDEVLHGGTGNLRVWAINTETLLNRVKGRVM